MINADNYKGNNRTNISSYGIRCTGSIRDYYRDNSDGMFVPTFDVVGPVKVDRSQYYINSMRNATQLMVDACTAADSLVNFSDYDVDGDGMVDMIYFIFSGLGSTSKATTVDCCGLISMTSAMSVMYAWTVCAWDDMLAQLNFSVQMIGACLKVLEPCATSLVMCWACLISMILAINMMTNA